MADISGFRASVVNGLVRPNSFRVELDFPAFVTGGAAAVGLGTFHCKAAQLPASNVNPIPVFYQGRSINVAGERTFDPWTVVVYNENFLVRDALTRWSHGINNIDNNTGVIQPALYQKDLVVKQLSRNGDVLKSIKLIDAMPIQVSPIELDFENNAQVEIFTCTFVYNYFTESNVNA